MDEKFLVYNDDLNNAIGHFSRRSISLLKRFYNYSRLKSFNNIDKEEKYSKKYLVDENQK